jgi:hypothetical protein
MMDFNPCIAFPNPGSEHFVKFIILAPVRLTDLSQMMMKIDVR